MLCCMGSVDTVVIEVVVKFWGPRTKINYNGVHETNKGYVVMSEIEPRWHFCSPIGDKYKPISL